jgi:isoquinoline 1-oxidoreductase beta subunit
VRESPHFLQLAGAEARERLLLAAANEWGVPATSLVAKDSIITHPPSKRRTTYGAMTAKAARIQLPDPVDDQGQDTRSVDLDGDRAVTGKRIRSLPLKNHDLSWG